MGFTDLEEAKFALFYHLYADFFSKRSLPIPGFSHFLDKGGQIAEVAVNLYSAGVNLKHLTQGIGKLSGVVLTELILRSYILLQRWRDEERPLLDLSSRIRYQEMFLVSHAISGSVGATAATVTLNPGLLNPSAIVAATKNAIALALRVSREKREAWDRVRALMIDTGREIDEMAAWRRGGVQPGDL